MSGSMQERLCRARELAGEECARYRAALECAGDGLGREIFGLLADQGARRAALIDQVSRALERGEDWVGACRLDESGPADARGVVADRADGRISEDACAEGDALARAAMELQAASVDFYDEWLDDAQDDTERRYVEQMIGELRVQRILLADLLGYYADPAAWSRNGDQDEAEEFEGA